MSRIVSIWLPRWPIQRFLIAQSKAPRSPETIDPRSPFILTIEAAGGPRIASASRLAEQEGLAAGGLVADARAKVPGLQTRPLAPEADAQALHRLGLWALRYTPAIALYRESDGADGLFLDITGASHLAGGEEALLADIVKRLRQFSLGARVALADTPGAAWALSRFHSQANFILAEGADPGPALTGLPLQALRLPDDLCQTLRRLGFKQVGDLIGKPRAPFASRFDPLLLRRFDQAMNMRDEALALVEPPPIYHRSRQLLEPVVSQAAVVHVATRLMQDLVPALTRDGVAARVLQLRLFRVDGEVRTIHIGLASATRDPSHVARLVTLDLERLGETIDAGFGFETISLAATRTEKIGSRQSRLSLRDGRRQPEADPGERRTELIDALRQRLGPGTVRQLHPVERHDPARSETARDAEEGEPVWPKPDRLPLRPPLFLDQPEPLQILATRPDGLPGHFRWRGAPHHITQLQGPERIAAPWWEQVAPALSTIAREEFGWSKKGDTPGSIPAGETTTSQKRNRFEDDEAGRERSVLLPAPARHDHYVAETQGGQRFWLCREATPRQVNWFMRGLFA
ncbi:Y-family DNA polymerase [Labrys okinawensis]|uniref:Y-family DNA polymerase n=1 Tax=Labrys okinawensis TaxID=346911 RepID=UPI0039BD6C87